MRWSFPSPALPVALVSRNEIPSSTRHSPPRRPRGRPPRDHDDGATRMHSACSRSPRDCSREDQPRHSALRPHSARSRGHGGAHARALSGGDRAPAQGRGDHAPHANSLAPRKDGRRSRDLAPPPPRRNLTRRPPRGRDVPRRAAAVEARLDWQPVARNHPRTFTPSVRARAATRRGGGHRQGIPARARVAKHLVASRRVLRRGAGYARGAARMEIPQTRNFPAGAALSPLWNLQRRCLSERG